MQKFITHSEKQTLKLAKNLAQKLKIKVFALYGELGAGKTIFVKGFAKGLGIKEKIISPTFVLIRQHKIPNSKRILYHIDLYRIEHLENLADIGLKEILSNPNNLILIEWAEKAKNYLPKNTLKIKLEKLDKDKRVIIIS